MSLANHAAPIYNRFSPMDTARIATLLEPFLLYPLSPAQLGSISTYIDLLLRWNARTNLTAIRNPDDIVTRHFGESLFAAQTLYPATTHLETAALGPGPQDARLSRAGVVSGPAERGSAEEDLDLLDLGSGAGFPGVPIHLWAPDLRTVLIESQQKKVAFLREVIRALTLTDINVSPARAEDFPSTARLVTLRAVERFGEILPTASRLVAPQSRLALLIAAPQAPTALRALLNFAWQPPIPIPLSSARVLLIGTSQ